MQNAGTKINSYSANYQKWNENDKMIRNNLNLEVITRATKIKN